MHTSQHALHPDCNFINTLLNAIIDTHSIPDKSIPFHKMHSRTTRYRFIPFSTKDRIYTPLRAQKGNLIKREKVPLSDIMGLKEESLK